MKTEQIIEESVLAKVKNKIFLKIGERTIICVLQMNNGLEFPGCVTALDLNNLEKDRELLERMAQRKAVRKVWEVEFYSIMEEKLKNKSKN
jgi:hypothetical protein